MYYIESLFSPIPDKVFSYEILNVFPAQPLYARESVIEYTIATVSTLNNIIPTAGLALSLGTASADVPAQFLTAPRTNMFRATPVLRDEENFIDRIAKKAQELDLELGRLLDRMENEAERLALIAWKKLSDFYDRNTVLEYMYPTKFWLLITYLVANSHIILGTIFDDDSLLDLDDLTLM